MRLNAYMVLATAYKRSGESGSELQTCLAAQQEFPNDPVLMLRLGGLYRRLGEIVRAADCFRRSLEAKTAHMSVLLFPDTRARAAVALGEMSIRLGHRQQAERLWQNFLKKHPHERQVRTALEKSLIETDSPLNVRLAYIRKRLFHRHRRRGHFVVFRGWHSTADTHVGQNDRRWFRRYFPTPPRRLRAVGRDVPDDCFAQHDRRQTALSHRRQRQRGLGRRA